MRRRSLLLSVPTLALMTGGGVLLAGCGGGGAAGGDPAAVPTPVPNPPSPPQQQVRTFAYVANYSSGDISIYRIEDGGVLAPAGTALVGAIALSVTVDPSGRFAYVVSEGGRHIYRFKVDATTGMLDARVAMELGTEPFQLRFLPSGEFAYVIVDSNNVSIYAVDADNGSLSRVGALTTTVQPYCMALDPLGRFAYIASQDDTVSSYAIGDQGGLTLINSVSAGVGGSPLSISVAPSGTFLHVANRAGTISVHSIDGSGGLSAGNLKNDGLAELRSFAIAPSGQLAYAITANNLSINVAPYTVNGSGQLTAEGETPTSGGALYALAIHSSGRFVYVTDQTQDLVWSYEVDQTDGSIMVQLNPVPTGREPAEITIANLVS